jgi:hypothetical protein
MLPVPDEDGTQNARKRHSTNGTVDEVDPGRETIYFSMHAGKHERLIKSSRQPCFWVRGTTACGKRGYVMTVSYRASNQRHLWECYHTFSWCRSLGI